MPTGTRYARPGRAPAWIVLGLAALLPLPGACATGGTAQAPTSGIFNVRLDNDWFAGRDQGYTSGLQLTAVSAPLSDAGCAADLARLPCWLDGRLGFLRGEHTSDRNLVLRIEQRIYTPDDPSRSDLVETDRPYAGTLMAVVGYNVRSGDSMHTTLLGIGVLGPASGARQTQRVVHDLIGSDAFHGWDHQLGNELLLGLRHERALRAGTRSFGDGGLQGDLIGHWGAGIGNPMTRINGGLEVRFGRHLPDDFGSSPVRPSGDNTAPLPHASAAQGWAWHVFLALDGYWSIHDPSLDGNLFRDSHSVDKHPLVAEAALGISITRGPWRLAFARYQRSREFSGQRQRPAFGSMTISRAI